MSNTGYFTLEGEIIFSASGVCHKQLSSQKIFAFLRTLPYDLSSITSVWPFPDSFLK